ncbi:uncharacterized protein LOC142625413 [Castanea sativa]|uniref:uncharacterized protein LOC142625413 n=1 Tax=Castanea sativa TaxID=21020 RepID=UPI003F64E50C
MYQYMSYGSKERDRATEDFNPDNKLAEGRFGPVYKLTLLSTLWNKLWTLNIPPKVRNFVWRACSNILPTRANLARRRVLIEPLCAICGQAEETVSHALWECPIARNVWAMVRGKLQKCGARIQTFHLLARQLMEKLTREEQELWAMVAWSIWNARNRFYFEDTQSQPSDILKGATTLLQDYHRWNGQMAHR